MGNAIFCNIKNIKEDEQLISEGFTERKILSGPRFKVLYPWKSTKKVSMIAMTKDEYILISNELDGTRKVIRGPLRYSRSSPYDTVNGPKAIPTLTDEQYMIVTEETTGERKVIKGPANYLPGPFESCSKILKCISLDHTQYVVIKNVLDGSLKVITGPTKYFPEYFEQKVGEVRRGVNIDDHHAALVRNTMDGSLRLVTKNQLFFPKADEDVEEIRVKIILEEYEVLVIINKDGHYIYKDGTNPEERAFFLEPYNTILTQDWSNDLEKEHKITQPTSRFDLRPSYMNYEFLIRTHDNVELVIDVAFFWQIRDVRDMVSHTSDVPRDICSRARTVIVEACSRVTLEDFIGTYNQIIESAITDSKEFYTRRGVQVHSAQVLEVKCKDKSTERVLQEIIQEATNRLNNRQKEESANEVRILKIQGDIREEEIRGRLLEVKRNHVNLEASNEGESEALQVSMFMKGIDPGLNLSVAQKVELWKAIRDLNKIDMLAASATAIYLTPEQAGVKLTHVNSGANHGARDRKDYGHKNPFNYEADAVKTE